ncbi:DUF883 C-terminal domain-containing protein [Gimesia algae]|uniref:Uncharacterized protein n=1 Tax=Gimesia algae TaxID=2527971 RepID=A0A517VB62_9PLAN|nr:DUF883 C-terminal domain-containing protein [Gimesia algae]QDT90237.1 hypothetical protein Pan161_18870 [Gimesia algae]
MIHQYEDLEKHIVPASHDQVKKSVTSKSSQVSHYVEEEPVKSVLISLGVGIGAGLLLGSMFRGSSRYFTRDEAFMDRVGNSVRDSLSEIVPASLRKHFRS